MVLVEPSRLRYQLQRKAVIIFDNFGPYHLARLEAVASKLSLTAIECKSSSIDYDWERINRRTNFRRITLFEGDQRHHVSPRKLKIATRRALADAQPDVVAIPGWSSHIALIALEWSLKNNIPVLVMSDSNAIDARRYWPKEAVKRRIISLTSSALAGGARSAQYLAQLGTERHRVFIGYDVVDNQYFIEGARRANADASELRRRFGLPGRYFLASARFVPKKNLSILLQAYARYKAAVGSNAWKLVILGDGPLRSNLHEERHKLGLDREVIFPGFIQYGFLPTYYGLASAFVHPSSVEQWGLVVNEALASSLPVLVSNRCGCAPELVKDGYNGFIFDPFDIEKLAGLMASISVHPNLARMGSHSQEVINRWSLDTFAEGLARAVEAALAAGSPHPTLIETILLRALSSL